jgi:hypothetical protein
LSPTDGSTALARRNARFSIYQHRWEQHLERYLDEFTFRYSNRNALGIDDTDHANRALLGFVGQRLTYRRIGDA